MVRDWIIPAHGPKKSRQLFAVRIITNHDSFIVRVCRSGEVFIGDGIFKPLKQGLPSLRESIITQPLAGLVDKDVDDAYVQEGGQLFRQGPDYRQTVVPLYTKQVPRVVDKGGGVDFFAKSKAMELPHVPAELYEFV
jgi:hypothetical protein